MSRIATLIGLLVAAVPALGVAQDSRFGDCLTALRKQAAGKKVTAATWERHITALTPDPRVLVQLDAQPEVKLPVWDYIAVMADQERVDDGLRLIAEHRNLFDSLGRRFGVDPAVLAAIWGIESNYGRGAGSYHVLRSLATLSCSGRRQEYFRRELFAALRIVQGGHVDPAKFVGSWAGAFGQTQFMPGTFEWLAVDNDGDGHKDVISNIGDALASTANFLRKMNWQSGEAWGFEVRASETLAGGDRPDGKRALSYWERVGITRLNGAPLAGGGVTSNTMAALYRPAGRRGPAFLVFDNFSSVMRYNASDRYTLAVLLLADRIKGAAPLSTPWPTEDPGLSRADRRELQTLLAARGYPIGTPNAILTPATVDAIKAEQKRLGLEVTGRAGQKLLAALRAK